MFEPAKKWIRSLQRPAPKVTSRPVALNYRCWVVLQDGQIAYIDHYKTDGKFGVRPVDPATGRHLLNSSEHWSMDDRERVPEEYALSLKEFRAAQIDEIPVQHRPPV